MPSANDPIRVVVATDSVLVGEGLSAVFVGVDDVDVVGHARDHYALLRLVDELGPDIVIYGVRTATTTTTTTAATVAVARHLRFEHPSMGFVVISDGAEHLALALLGGGASRVGYLLDDCHLGVDAVLACLRLLRQGQSVLDASIVDTLVASVDGAREDGLTDREGRVWELMADGLSNGAIAATMILSAKVVERAITAVFLKLGPVDRPLVDCRVSAMRAYLRANGGALVPTRRSGWACSVVGSPAPCGAPQLPCSNDSRSPGQ